MNLEQNLLIKMNLNLIFDILTWIAVTGTLISYILVSRKIIDGYSWTFQITTLVARISFLAVNLIRQTYPFAFMDSIFLIICILTMYQLYQDSSNAKLSTSSIS